MGYCVPGTGDRVPCVDGRASLGHSAQTLNTLHPTPYTLSPIPYTLSPIPYPLYPIPYTLYPVLSHPHHGLQPEQIAAPAKAADLPYAHSGDHRRVAKFLTGVNVGEVDFDRW